MISLDMAQPVLFRLYRHNLIGSAAGAGACALGLLLFFASLGYVASDIGGSGQRDILAGSAIFAAVPFMMSWSIIFYALQQAALLTGAVTAAGYSESFLAMSILPPASFALALLAWASVGAMVQSGLRNLRRQA